MEEKEGEEKDSISIDPVSVLGYNQPQVLNA